MNKRPASKAVLALLILPLLCGLAHVQDSGLDKLKTTYTQNLDRIAELQKASAWAPQECRRMMSILEDNEKLAKQMSSEFAFSFDKTDALIRKQNFLVQNMHDFLTVSTLKAVQGRAVMLVIGKTPLHPEFAGLNLLKISDRDVTYVGLAEAEARDLHLWRSQYNFPGKFADMTKLDIAEGEATLARTSVAQLDDLATTAAVSPELHRTYSGLQFCSDYALTTGEIQTLDEKGRLRVLRLAPEPQSKLAEQIDFATQQLKYAVDDQSKPGIIRLTREGFSDIEIFRGKEALIDAANHEFERVGSPFRFQKQPPPFALGLVSDIDAQLRLNLDKVPREVEEEFLDSTLSPQELKQRKAQRILEKRAKIYEKYGKRYAVAMNWVGAKVDPEFETQLGRLMSEHRYDEVPALITEHRRTIADAVADAQARQYQTAFREYEKALRELAHGDPELAKKLHHLRMIEADTRGAMENFRRLLTVEPSLEPMKMEDLKALFGRGPPYALKGGAENALFKKLGEPVEDLSDELFAGRPLSHAPRVLDRHALLEYMKHNPGATILQIGGTLFALKEVWDEFRSTSDPSSDLRWLNSLAKTTAGLVVYDAIPLYFELTAGEAAAGLYNMVALGVTAAVIAVKLAGDYVIRRLQKEIVGAKLLKAFGGVTSDGKPTQAPEFFATLGVALTEEDLRAPQDVKLGVFENGKIIREKDDDGNFVFKSLKEEYHEQWDQGDRGDLEGFFDERLKWTTVTISPGQLIVSRLLDRTFDKLRAEYVRTVDGKPSGWNEFPEDFRHLKGEVFLNTGAAVSQAEFRHYMTRFVDAWNDSPARIAGGYAAHDQMDREIIDGAYRQFMEAMIQRAYENDGARISFERSGPVELRAWIQAGVPIKIDGHVWTTEELQAELKRRWAPYEEGAEEGREMWLPIVRLRFPPEKPPLGAPTVAIGEAKFLRSAEAAPVRTAEGAAGEGEKLYVGESGFLVLRYTVSDPGNGALNLALETDGKLHWLGHPAQQGGSIVEHNLGKKAWSEAGEHEVRYPMASPDAGQTRRYVFVLKSRDAELARSAPIVLTGFPYGWALKEIVTDARKNDLTSHSDFTGIAKKVEVTVEDGVLTARRTRTRTGRKGREPFKTTEVDTFTLGGIPTFLIDGKTYPLQAQWNRTWKSTREDENPLSEGLPLKLDIQASSQWMDVTGAGTHGYGYSTRLTREDLSQPDSQIAFKVNRLSNSKHFAQYDMTIELKEDSTSFSNLVKTIVLRYVRVDEMQGAQPIAWRTGGGGSTGFGRGDATPGSDVDLTRGTGDGSEAALPPYVTASDCGKGRTTGDASPQPTDPLAVLRTAQPWKDTTVQHVIDDWIGASSPDIQPAGPDDKRTWRWSPWAVAHSESTKIAGPPDHGTMDRHEYLFAFAGRFQSRRHGTLREYIEARLRGESGERPESARRSPLRELQSQALQGGTKTAPPVGHQVGSTAPEIDAEQISRKLWRLTERRGKVVVLSTYMVADFETHPALDFLARIQKIAPANAVDVAAVSVDLVHLEGDVMMLSEERGLAQENFLAINREKFVGDYAIESSPTVFIVDGDGVIRYRASGAKSEALATPEFLKIMKDLVPGVDWNGSLQKK